MSNATAVDNTVNRSCVRQNDFAVTDRRSDHIL